MNLASPIPLLREPARAAPAGVPATFVSRLCTADDGLLRLRSEWTSLAEDAAEPNSFAEYWFVAASIPTLGARDLRIAEIRRAGRLIGVMPITQERDYGRIRTPFVQNWCHHHLFLGTPLVRKGEEEAFWTEMLALLDADAGPGHFLHLRSLTDDGPVHRGLVAAATASGRICAAVHREQRALLHSELGPEEYYLTQIRAKKRKEIRRLQSRLAEQGKVDARRLDRRSELAEYCDLFLALERAGWKGKAGSALACRSETSSFFRSAVEGAFDAGKLDFLRLDLDGRPIAMLVNFLSPPGSFSFKTCFDEDFARFSPGVLIQLENLQMLSRPDIEWADSCAAEDHPMIDSLWSGRRTIIRVTVERKGFRHGLVLRACRALERGSAAARAFRARRQG